MSRARPTVPPTDQPDTVALTLADGKKWDVTSTPTAKFPRARAAVLLLSNAGSTAEPELTADELRSGAREAFLFLETQRAGSDPDVYLRRFPRRRACYERLADLMKVEVPA